MGWCTVVDGVCSNAGAATGVRTQPSAGVLQYNGRLPYTANNGCRQGADNHMPVWNAPFQPKGDAEQR